jgi:hypothetical protein
MLEGSSVATATGLIQGTPAYMAPEQAMGGKVDHSADVYALGVMAFECLTGRVPYTGTTPVAVLMKHVQEPVPEPAAAEVAPPLTAVLRRCLAKTPGERWPSAGAFTAALEQAASGATPPGGLAPLQTLHLPSTPATGTPSAGPSPLAASPAAESPVRRNLLWAAAGGLASLVVLSLAGFLLVPRLIGPERPPSSSTSLPAPSRPSEASPTGAPTGPPTAAPSAPATARAATPRRATPAPTVSPSAAPAPQSTPDPTPAPARASAPARVPGGKIRVHCEAKLEPNLFRKTGPKDVADSLKDLKEAIAERGALELVPRHEADAVVQVLERGREPAVIGMRKVRVRVVLGRESVELAGQDSMTGFNTWSGAAKGAAKQVESWLAGRLAPGE